MNLLSNKERTPEPYVSFLLDESCIPPFRPGSSISGTVTLQCSSERQLQVADAIFFGRAVTNCTRTESMGTNYFRRANFSTNQTLQYHDDACLFRYQLNLCQSSSLHPHQTYSWKFSFAFPHSANLVGNSPYRPTENSGIYASDRHLLPPSFARYFNDNHYATVEYSVQAVFRFGDTPLPLTMQLPPLDFLPHPGWPDASTLIEFVRPPEKFSSSRLADDHESLKRRMSNKISSQSNIPSVDLVLKASLNTCVKQSAPTSIYFCVEIGTLSEKPLSLHSVNMRVRSLKLCQITVFRAREVEGSMREYQEIGEHSITLNAVPSQLSAQPQTKPSENGNIIFFPATFEARIPHDVPPSFRTFNINQSHRLKVVMEAEVAGKTFEHKIVVEQLNVVPS